MGWGDCGVDKKGRPIGYVHEAICDHEGCEEKIDRGLSYACGGMHGENEIGCDKYFCSSHLSNTIEDSCGDYYHVCDKCRDEMIESGEWKFDDINGVIVEMDSDDPANFDHWTDY